MKNLFKLLAFVIFLTLAACYENEQIVQEEQLKESNLEINSRVALTGCDINSVSTSGTEIVYTVDISNIPNPIFNWTIVNGNINIVGSNANQTVTINFDVANFTGGEIAVTVNDPNNANNDCTTFLVINEGDCPNPNPCEAYSSLYIQELIPACYPASHPYGRYRLYNYSGNVSWSVNYGIIKLQAGNEVHVEATSSYPFTLTAIINTEEGCTKEINKVIYPCDANEGGFGK